jgi:hypothetical protein
MSCANTNLPEYMMGNPGRKTPVSQKIHVQAGDTHKCVSMEGEVLKNNSSMLHLLTRLGFTAEASAEEDDIKIVRKVL